MTEDDIVGPRLYPDPEAGVADAERLEPTVVEVNTARICPKFTDEGLYFVKFPNFLSIEPRPFDQDHYEDEFDEDDLLDEEGRARLKLRVCILGLLFDFIVLQINNCIKVRSI